MTKITKKQYKCLNEQKKYNTYSKPYNPSD